MEMLRHGDSFFLSDHDSKPRGFMNSSRGDGEPIRTSAGCGTQSEVDEKSGTPKRAA
jgi:hypothetical protein